MTETCDARIPATPEPCSMPIEWDGARWRHVYQRVDLMHAAVLPAPCDCPKNRSLQDHHSDYCPAAP